MTSPGITPRQVLKQNGEVASPPTSGNLMTTISHKAAVALLEKITGISLWGIQVGLRLRMMERVAELLGAHYCAEENAVRLSRHRINQIWWRFNSHPAPTRMGDIVFYDDGTAIVHES